MFPTVHSEDNKQVEGTSLARNPVVASDAGNSTENSQDSQISTQRNRNLTFKMLIKEMILCIALALSSYGALQSIPTMISKHPQAIRFFQSESVVTDWYKGQLSNALSIINQMDVSFVMYYAPWDAESQYVRREFEKTAMILKDRVYFAAINCWNPGSECRLQHSKIPSWPILMVYTVNSRGILYKGLRDAHSMVNFLELIIKPLRRISSTEDIVNLLSMCDAVAVGYTPLAYTSKYYNIWYHVALKSHEFDTIGEICFAVVTSEELAVDLGVSVMPNARLMLWNDTKEYITGESNIQSWNESLLMHWVLENFSQPVARIIPLWKKAFTFERYADGNPIMILFSPLNPLLEQLPSYALLREVAMEYYNCRNNDSAQWVSELVKLQRAQRLLYQQRNYTRLCEKYDSRKVTMKKSRHTKKEIQSHNNKYPWNNATYKPQKSGLDHFLLRRGLHLSKAMESTDDNSQLFSSLGLLDECNLKDLPAERSFYDNYEQCLTYQALLNYENDVEADQEDSETSMLPNEDDNLSPDNLIQNNIKHFCTLTKFAHERNSPVSPSRTYDKRVNISDIQGLSCANNFSLHILAMDSIQNRHFAESLGIDIVNKKDMTAVIILDNTHESQYVLSEEYSTKSVRDFIYNFTKKRLKRSLRTLVTGAAHTHFYGSNGISQQMVGDKNVVNIIDLTTKTFKKVVKTPGTVTIVVLCGGACGALVSGALAQAARVMSASGVRVQVARLDAQAHDLPWPYTAPRYPTLLVFPPHSNGESESRAYPLGEHITSSGIVALALRSLSPPLNMRVRFALCASVQAQTEKKKCLKDIREHITTVIGRNLKYWRRTDNKDLKEALVQRLQHLHKVSLNLSLINLGDLIGNSNRRTLLMDSLCALSNNWEIDASSVLRRNVTSSSRSS